MIRQAAISLIFWGSLSSKSLGFSVPQPSHQAAANRFQTKLLSTLVRSEPMPWTQNTETYGPFDHQDWAWVYTTCPEEASASYTCQDIEGVVPRDLVGTFYRSGPGNFEREGRRYDHVLDGDGFVAAFRFEDGKVKYTGRFVETEFYKEETEQDKILYRNVFGTQPKGGILKNAFDLTLKNVANTNVIHWGDRLFVLWEAGRPYELDPDTLETLPAADDDPLRKLGDPCCSIRGVTMDDGGPLDEMMNTGRFFTAHPHIEDDTLVGFRAAQNARTKAIEMDFCEIDKDWCEKKCIRYSAPNCAAAPHDFSIGDNYFAFFQNRLELDQLQYILGLKAPTQSMQMQLDKPGILHLVPRSSDQKPLRLEIPAYFNIHTVPKIEQEGNQLIFYSNGWNLKDERFFPQSVKSMPFLGSWSGKYPNFEKGVPTAVLYRTVVDLESEQVVSHEAVVPDLVMEFPTQDNDGYVYFSAAATDNASLPGTGLCRLNLKSREPEYWWAEPKIFTGEIVPVPKRNGKKGNWLLTLLYDFRQKRTSLAILDSERFEQGPIGRIHLPHSLSYGLHNCFAEAA